jgi:type III restriction enzyme
LRLRSRHQLFPQVYAAVDAYVRRKVHWQDCHPCELGLATYGERAVERLYDAIEPDDDQGEPPLLPILNHYKPMGSTTEVDFRTTCLCYATIKSPINQVVLDTATSEQSAAFRLEQSDAVAYYARNDHLEFVIPYEYQAISHGYIPDYLVRLTNGMTLILEIKGYEDDQDRAKHQAAQWWKTAVNRFGYWRG